MAAEPAFSPTNYYPSFSLTYCLYKRKCRKSEVFWFLFTLPFYGIGWVLPFSKTYKRETPRKPFTNNWKCLPKMQWHLFSSSSANGLVVSSELSESKNNNWKMITEQRQEGKVSVFYCLSLQGCLETQKQFAPSCWYLRRKAFQVKED